MIIPQRAPRGYFVSPLFRKLTIMIVLTSSACGDDGGGASDDVDPSTLRDAGARPDARVDARAPADEDEDDEGENDEPVVDAGEDLPAPEPRDASVRDAGRATSDAGSTRSDAGSTTQDAGAGSLCDTLTYTSFGQKFMTDYCVSCHGSTLAQKNIRLDTLAGVTASKSKVKSEVSKNAMPPFGSKAPSSAERTQLSQWITCGPK